MMLAGGRAYTVSYLAQLDVKASNTRGSGQIKETYEPAERMQEIIVMCPVLPERYNGVEHA
jgi:hypothetical protein